MTAQEIVTALLSTPRLDTDALEPLREFRRDKRKTGAPTDLEDNAIVAAEALIEHVAALRLYLERAEKEAHEALEAMALADRHVFFRTWFQLDNRNSAEKLAATAADRHKAFADAVQLWAALADRIIATPEETARVEEQTRAAEVAAAKPARRKRAT